MVSKSWSKPPLSSFCWGYRHTPPELAANFFNSHTEQNCFVREWSSGSKLLIWFLFPWITLDAVAHPHASILIQCGVWFSVFPGELINWLALDREHQGHHHMTVLVTDHGSPPRNASMLVYVTVTDINDNRPYFPQCLPGKEFHIKVCQVYLQGVCNAFRVICFERHLMVKDVNSPSQPWLCHCI